MSEQQVVDDGEPELSIEHVKWAEGATLAFLCQSCGHAQPAAPGEHEGGITADQARADGWVIADGLVLCPESVCGIRRRESSASAPLDVPLEATRVESFNGHGEQTWDGQRWVCYAKENE